MKFQKLEEVMKVTGLSRSAIYKLVMEGGFPPQVSLGGRAVAWVEDEVQKWMTRCMADRTSANSSSKGGDK